MTKKEITDGSFTVSREFNYYFFCPVGFLLAPSFKSNAICFRSNRWANIPITDMGREICQPFL